MQLSRWRVVTEGVLDAVESLLSGNPDVRANLTQEMMDETSLK
jgi:hypothetical protein